jgi:hypothetical protein
MKPGYLLTVAALALAMQVCAQNGRRVSGLVQDSAGTALLATVRLLADKDSVVIATNVEGRFSFTSVTANQFSLLVSSLGYQAIKRRYTLVPGNTTAELDPIVLKSDAIVLKGVTVSGVVPVKVKEDTLEYSAAAYRVRQGAAVEDAIRKMPGLEVSRDGAITAQGKQISKVQLNGKDYMAGDVKSLTRNLPADAVQNVQVIDDYGDQAKLTGVKTGEAQKVLNINIRKDKNFRYLAQAAVGAGQDVIQGTKDAGRYVASGNIFNFRGKRQITVSGDLNNTNTSLFDFNGEGRKGPSDLSADKQSGIITASALGFNYRDDWSKKVTVYGSYSLADNSAYTISKTVRDNLSGQSPSTQTSNSIRDDRNLNHRIQLNMEYKPDTLNYFKFIPKFSYGGVHSNETFASQLQAKNSGGDYLSDYTGTLFGHSSAPNFGLSALYNHRFGKRGRNLSALVTSGVATTDQYQNPVYNYLAGRANAPVNQVINIRGRTDSVSVSLSYLERIGKRSYLEFNYNYHNAGTTADRLTDTIANTGVVNPDPDLSNDYHFNFIFNRFGLNYQLIDKKYKFILGLTAQPTSLEGSSSEIAPSNHKSFNFAPLLRYVYNFSDIQALAFSYRGASNPPAYYQLQPVTDFANASYPVQGNPDLLPEYNNTFEIKYNKFINGTGTMFFTNLNFTQTDHKIVANTVSYPQNYTADPKLAGVLLTKYQNASGFYNASAYYVLAGDWARRRYTWIFNGNISYNNHISYLTDVLDSTGTDQTVQKNTAKNLVLAQSARFRADITDVVDADVNASYLISHTDNTIRETNLNNNFQTISLGTNGKFYFFEDWTLSYNYSKVIYEGYQGATNPNILNTYLERRFLKKNIGTLRFSVYDLFNENTGFTSSQNAYAVTQRNVNRLGRYYLLTLTLRLQKNK